MPTDPPADPAAYGLRPAPDGCRLRVLVTPRAATNRLLGPHEGVLKVALTAPPVEGAANTALCAFLAACLHLPRGRVTLIAGQTSRHKELHIVGMAPEDALAHLRG